MASMIDKDLPGFINPKDKSFPRSIYAFTLDGVGIIIGSLLGCAPLTVCLESAAGIREGGRTGVTAIVVRARCHLGAGWVVAVWFTRALQFQRVWVFQLTICVPDLRNLASYITMRSTSSHRTAPPGRVLFLPEHVLHAADRLHPAVRHRPRADHRGRADDGGARALAVGAALSLLGWGCASKVGKRLGAGGPDFKQVLLFLTRIPTNPSPQTPPPHPHPAQNVVDIDWGDIREAVPAFLTMAIMPLTYSVAYGVIAGLVAHIVISVRGGLRVLRLALGVACFVCCAAPVLQYETCRFAI